MIAADDQVEARRGVLTHDPGQGLGGVWPAIDRVAEREQPVGRADLQLGERMAMRPRAASSNLRDYITGETVRGQRPTEAGADE